MADIKTPKTPKQYECTVCRFICSNKKDYYRHLLTAKHKRLTLDLPNTSQNTPKPFCCECGKSYIHRQSLHKHKHKCKKTDKLPHVEKEETKNDEIKSLFLQMIEIYQNKQVETNQQNHENTMEIVNKVLESMPKAGNTTNNTYIEKQTLNFYLTNTCKEAESIHDFTDRYVKRCIDFFQENYLQVAYNEVNLASNIYTLFFNCLEENPQNLNFVQTTDAKNGILYVKEKKKNENRELHGEAEFIKYMDGFEKAGLNICHAINRALNPLQSKYEKLLQEQCGPPPCEEDYEDEEQFEQMHDRYKEKTNNLKCNLMMQIFDTARLFDDKQRRNEILSKTKRLKEN